MSEDSHSFSHNDNGSADETDVAFAAEAAAQAVEEADAATAHQGAAQGHQQLAMGSSYAQHQQQQRQGQELVICNICGRGEDDRPILRFPPLHHQDDEIYLHVFCGKTASILPNVNRPDMEILSKAGLKNKFGIGPEVNAALARSRCAVLNQQGAKEKQFYLVKEFEAHLAAVKNINIPARQAEPFPPIHYADHMNDMQPHAETLDNFGQDPHDPHLYLDMNPAPVENHFPVHKMISHPIHKEIPHKANAARHDKPGRRSEDISSDSNIYTSDGKVKCGCGGTHLPAGRRSHEMTKRHQKWLEENGMQGTSI